MTAQQHAMTVFYAWFLALGFIVMMTLIVCFSLGLAKDGGLHILLVNRQHRRERLAWARLRTEFARAGGDPEYVDWLQQRAKLPIQE